MGMEKYGEGRFKSKKEWFSKVVFHINSHRHTETCMHFFYHTRSAILKFFLSVFCC